MVFRYVRATAEDLPDLDALEASGVYELVAEHWEDGEVRQAVAAWSKVELNKNTIDPTAKVLNSSFLAIGFIYEVLLEELKNVKSKFEEIKPQKNKVDSSGRL